MTFAAHLRELVTDMTLIQFATGEPVPEHVARFLARAQETLIELGQLLGDD